jgi:hypothetical protein
MGRYRSVIRVDISDHLPSSLRMNTRTLRGLPVVALLTLGLPAASSAQTFEACRVPSVGVIYMINVGDAPTACLDPSHVQFSWTEGGAPADGSITTAKLADGAVTSAKIADGIVSEADLAANSVGAAESGLEVVITNSSDVQALSQTLVSNCPAGKRAISGGYHLTAVSGGNIPDFTTTFNGPTTDNLGWQVVGRYSALGWSWRVFAICVLD